VDGKQSASMALNNNISPLRQLPGIYGRTLNYIAPSIFIQSSGTSSSSLLFVHNLFVWSVCWPAGVRVWVWVWVSVFFF